MKKLTIIIICLIFVICLFSGCKNQEIVDPMPEQDQPTNGLSMAMAPFKMATSVYVTDGCGNEDGFYTIRNNNMIDHEDMSRNILYIDYATKKQVYLCAQPNCSHNNEACTSWLAPGSGETILALSEDKLVVLYVDVLPRIEIMDLNGANRKTLCNFGDGAAIGYVAVFNGQYLVLPVERYVMDDIGQVSSANTLCAVDMETGEQTTVFTYVPETNDPTLAGYSRVSLMGITDTGFIMSSVTMGVFEYNENPEITFENMQRVTEYKIFELPYNGGEAKTLLTYFEDDPCMVSILDRYLFFIRNIGGAIKLIKMDVATGETTTLIGDFADAGMIRTAVYNTINNWGIDPHFAGNRIFLKNIYTPEIGADRQVDYFSVDIDTGTIQEITLSYSYNATRMPMPILAVFGDSMLIHAKVEDLPNVSGTGYFKFTPAIISADDYLASNPNFDWIDTV